MNYWIMKWRVLKTEGRPKLTWKEIYTPRSGGLPVPVRFSGRATVQFWGTLFVLQKIKVLDKYKQILSYTAEKC